MGRAKTIRKKKSAYKKYKRELRGLLAVQKAIAISHSVIGVAQGEAIRQSAMHKCTRCKYSYEENVGGIILTPNLKSGKEPTIINIDSTEQNKEIVNMLSGSMPNLDFKA